MTHPEVAAFNEADDGPELGRTVWLHVSRVSADVLAVMPNRRKKRISPRVIEMGRVDAQKLIGLLEKRLQDGMVGSITFVLYGVEEI